MLAVNRLFSSIAARAAANHGIVSSDQIRCAGVSGSTLTRWRAAGMLISTGPRSYAVCGSPPTWERDLAAAVADLDGRGFLAGRTAARLHRLDGFTSAAVEVLVPQDHRGLRIPVRLAATCLPLDAGSSVTIDGFRCLTAERLILDAPLFDFSVAEIENAIDSAIRLCLVGEQRLRTSVVQRHRRGINGGRALLDALVDTGGESRLERWVLQLVGRAGLPRPELRTTYRDGNRTIARVDMQFGDDLIVEIAGHGTHSSRRQLQADDQRRTELIRLGFRVVTFRYEDVRDRPGWVVDQLRALIVGRAAA